MEIGPITEIASLLFGGGIGAIVTQIYMANANKKKIQAETASTLEDINRKRLDAKQDAFDTMYQQLNQCMKDYSAISEEYRDHREKMRKYEDSIQEQIRLKCEELADLKSQITYLKGIRCYDTLCPWRIAKSSEKTLSKRPNCKDCKTE